MGRWHKAWLLGVATAVIGIAASAVSSDWEADLGLGLLFKLRGARQSPPDIVVVGIDRESSQVFDVPNRPDKWPRRCLLYTSPSPRDRTRSRMPSSA